MLFDKNIHKMSKNTFLSAGVFSRRSSERREGGGGGLLLQRATGGGKSTWAWARPEVPGADGASPSHPAASRASQGVILVLALAEDPAQSAGTDQLSEP